MRATFVLLSLLLLACPPDPPSPPSIVSFTASAGTLCFPGDVTLSWVQANGTTLSLNDGTNTFDVSGQTKRTVSVLADTTFTLTASNTAGTKTASAVVLVRRLPREPLVGQPVQTTLGAAMSFDRTRLAIPGFVNNSVVAFVCSVAGCVKQVLYTQTGFDFSDMTLGSFGGQFFALQFAYGRGSLPSELRYTRELPDSGFAAFQKVLGADVTMIEYVQGADEQSGRILLAQAREFSDNAVITTELVGTTWTTDFVSVAGTLLANVRVLAADYDAQGRAWLLYRSAPDVLTVVRRSGGAWEQIATTSVAGGAMLTDNFAAAASRDGRTALVSWFTGGAGWVRSFDVTSGSFGAPSAVLTALGAHPENFTSSVDFSRDGERGTYVMSVGDGRAWTGHYVRSSDSFAGNALFHPELYISASPRVFYGACDAPALLYGRQAGSSSASTVYFDPL